MTLQERFEAKVMPEPNSCCLLWIGAMGVGGYGVIKIERKKRIAHRIAYELYRAKIPEGLDVLHQCDTPLCCNPMHLFLGTQADNARDMHSKGRAARFDGERNPRAKLTSLQVEEIRSSGKSGPIIAKRFGISRSQVNNIRRGEQWA